jgi:hypothetical protein
MRGFVQWEEGFRVSGFRVQGAEMRIPLLLYPEP